MLVLAAERARRGSVDAGRPRRDAGHALAALMGVHLVQAERRVRHHAPSHGVVGQRPWRAELVDARRVHLERLEPDVGAVVAHERAEVGARAVVLSFARPAVVGREDEDRVVPLAHSLERGAQLTEAAVDRRHHGGEDLLVARPSAAARRATARSKRARRGVVRSCAAAGWYRAARPRVRVGGRSASRIASQPAA